MKRHIPVQIEWHPDPAQAVPVYRQILEWMYGKIESGEWPAGTRLPSQREMARHFQVNRSTLNQALKPLLEAGVLQGRGSQGTVVASTAWSLRLPVQPDWNRYMTAGYFRANQEVVQAINTLEFDDRLVRLGTGELDPRLFPQDAFRQTMRDVADTILPQQTSHGTALPQSRIGWRPHQSRRYLFQPPHPVSAPVLCLYDAGRIPPGCQSAGCGCPFAGRMKDTVKPSALQFQQKIRILD